MKRTLSSGSLAAPEGREGRSGFTLTELLVVIAIIGLLAGLLLPVLGRAKAKGHALFCLNNQRQLGLAWLMYAHDFEDNLPFNLGPSETKETVASGEFLNWVNNVMTWDLDEENTNEVLVTKGGIGPYTGGVAKLYRCPSDSAVGDRQRKAGWTGRVRSVSMNAMVGNAGEYTAFGTNVNNPYYRQFFKLAQVPNPSDIFVFIEEHPDSINDGYFINNGSSGEWNDLPASYHNGGCHLTFADGHAEYHQWVCDSTKPPPIEAAAKLPLQVPLDQRADFDWLMARTSLRRGTYRASQ